MGTVNAQRTVLCPSLHAFFRSSFGKRWLSALGLVLLGAVATVITHPDGIEVMVLLVGIPLALLATIAVLYRVRARIWLEGDRVVWRKIVGHGSFPVAQVKAAFFDSAGPRFTIANRENRRLLRVHAALWSEDSLTTLARFVRGAIYGGDQ